MCVKQKTPTENFQYEYMVHYTPYTVMAKNIGTQVNMNKEGCENESALLIILLIFFLNIHNLIFKLEITLWNTCFSLIHIGYN